MQEIWVEVIHAWIMIRVQNNVHIISCRKQKIYAISIENKILLLIIFQTVETSYFRENQRNLWNECSYWQALVFQGNTVSELLPWHDLSFQALPSILEYASTLQDTFIT